MTALDFGRFEALTFDCYGTLIDWEAGIEVGLRRLLGPAGAAVPIDDLLATYATAETELEAGPYRSYRQILATAGRTVARRHGIEPSEDALDAFGGSVADWPAFPDSAAALERLQRRFRLGIITNCDDDLFAASNRRLGVTFDWVVTAEQAQSYKPSERNFEVAFERLGLPRDRVLHVAQSLFHDHVPAKRLGLSSVWIDRRHDKAGFGATPPAEAMPDVTFPDMATFAAAAVP